MEIVPEYFTRKYAGLLDPKEEETIPILRARKAKFQRFVRRMIGYAPRIRSMNQDPMPTDKDQTIIKSAKAGLIPWPMKNESPDEYIERWKEKNMESHRSDSGFKKVKHRPWGEYFYTCFFSLAPKIILMDEETVIELREHLQQPAKTAGLPQDGSKGQARASRGNRRKTVDWFIGQWDGHYTDWEEKVTPDEQHSP